MKTTDNKTIFSFNSCHWNARLRFNSSFLISVKYQRAQSTMINHHVQSIGFKCVTSILITAKLIAPFIKITISILSWTWRWRRAFWCQSQYRRGLWKFGRFYLFCPAWASDREWFWVPAIPVSVRSGIWSTTSTNSSNISAYCSSGACPIY